MRFALFLCCASVFGANVNVPIQAWLPGTPINATNTNAHHPQYSPDGTMLAWEQSRPLSGGAYDVVVANADGSSPVVITQTTFAKANLPKSGAGTYGNPQWAPDSQGLIIQAQSASSVLSFSQANPGAGSDNGLWYIDKAGATKILELAGDMPCSTTVLSCIQLSQTQGGFLQFRMSRQPGSDGNYFFFGGHTWSWACASAIGGLCQRLELFDYTQVGGTPALTGTGVNNGLEGASPFVATSGAPATGTNVCTATATGSAGLNAAGTIRFSAGAWARLVVTFNGNSYASPPTSWTLSGPAACSAVSPLTTTGGALSGADYNACLTGPTNCFIEGGDTDPTENPAHTLYISQFSTVVSQGLVYSFDLSNTGAGAVLQSPASGWNEMPAWSPFFHTFCLITSTVTPFTPAQGSPIPLDLACSYPLGSGVFYPVTFFNTPGSVEFYNAGGNHTSFGVFSISPDGTHMAAEIFNNQPLPFGFANVYILSVRPAATVSGATLGGVTIN